MSKAPVNPELALTTAAYEAALAKKQLSNTVGALQYRLKPATLMSNAWEGVREKSGNVADGAVNTAKERPITISSIAAALLIFLAREPLIRFITGLFGPKRDETVVTADLDQPDENFDLTAPVVERSRHEGVSA